MKTLTAVTAVTGICASVVGIVLALAGSGQVAGLVGALLVACISPGAAVMSWADVQFGVVQAGLTLVLSLTITGIFTSCMLWLTAWHPKALLGLALASAISCGVRLRRDGLPRLGRPSLAGQSGQWIRCAPLIIGLAAWAYGTSRITPAAIGSYGLLASANIWFFVGLATVLGGGLVELLRRRPVAWLLGAYVVGLIVVGYATVPILFKVPEYDWVYKHIGIVEVLGHYGRVTDPTNIYQEWPTLFSAVAAVSGVAKVGPLQFAAWAPLAFELADALLLLGIFRMLAVNRRAAYLAVFLYEGLIAWVGQDYLSPQAFGYLLWLGIVAVMVRWLLTSRADEQGNVLARLRARLLTRMPALPAESTTGQRKFAMILAVVIYFAIVASHQLTPYMVLLAVGSLVLLGVLWRGWLFLAVLTIVAFAYLIPRYGLISSQFGGIFSGGNALGNASGVQNLNRQGGEAFTSEIVHVLAVGIWLLSLVAVVRNWRSLGQVAIFAVLAFSPFVVVLLQSYGGEAIYRVYMFSSPWCAILIADLVMNLQAVSWRRFSVGFICVAALVAGWQGDYGPVAIDAFTPQEVAASLWLYGHAPKGSLLILAANDFPMAAGANFVADDRQVIPADPQSSTAWVNEAKVSSITRWMTSIKRNSGYLVLSRSMDNYQSFWGYPRGYLQLRRMASRVSGWSVVYHNADTTIYRIRT